jgi:penicillin amidase
MIFFGFLLFFVLLLFPFLYLKDLRQYSGVKIIPGIFLNDSIKIFRDENDVPHIESNDLRNCLFGLGYTHAQDRLFSIHMQKVIFSGRLSEFFGMKYLEMDKFMRNLLLKRTSIENKNELDEKIRELAQSYVDGVNAFAENLYFLPNEFWISGLKYEPFTIEDGMTMFKYIGFALTYDWQYEILREKVKIICFFRSKFPYN